jgi:transportin-3
VPTLHTFLSGSGTKLRQDDRIQVYEAIAYVISAMPMNRAGEALRTFAFDLLGRISAAASQSTTLSAHQLKDVCGMLLVKEV